MDDLDVVTQKPDEYEDFMPPFDKLDRKLYVPPIFGIAVIQIMHFFRAEMAMDEPSADGSNRLEAFNRQEILHREDSFYTGGIMPGDTMVGCTFYRNTFAISSVPV